ncbi:MAG: hypothetical protein O7A98_02270 [Acidobacteria bacterium]|nr:hypothetical protein [Acidobacteriota bacterium]
MNDEPRKHPVYMVLLGLVALGSVPLWFVGAAPTDWLGLPVWLWSSIGFTLALSGMIAWGILRYWRDDDDARR